MTEKVDVLFINPGNRKQIYQDLGDEFCGIEPPVFAGLFATYIRKKGSSVALIDGPALNLSAKEIAKTVVDDFDASLVVIVGSSATIVSFLKLYSTTSCALYF